MGTLTKPKRPVVNLLKIIVLFNGNIVVNQSVVDLLCSILKEKVNAKDVHPKVITIGQLKETLEYGQKPGFIVIMPGFERDDIIEIKRRVPETAQVVVLKHPLEDSLDKLSKG